MKVFKDSLGREWSYTLNVASMKKIRSATGIDLMQADKTLPVLGDDMVALSEVLWVLCKQQAQDRGISEEQFYEGLSGEALDSARDGFFEEWADFFPPSQTAKKTLLLSALELGRAYNEAYRKEMERHFQEISRPDLVEAKVRADIQQAISKTKEQEIQPEKGPPTPGA